jgi:hypothetical protein
MRVKIQVKNGLGLFQDMLIDPAQKHMLALDFSPDDLLYMERRQVKNVGQQRLILPFIPVRIKVRVNGPEKGSYLDVVADRTNLDWIAIELTPTDILRLTAITPGPASRLITYAGPPGNTVMNRQMIEQFKSEWPPFCGTNPNDPKEAYGGVPHALAQQDGLASAFRIWANEWPPMFHGGQHTAPEAQLILPSGAKV